ncbi:hypothetical protein R1flu_013821 [Riccia fluitans]|uniref:Uncharacterized protein n=1 Tax=Riccia fluitans TaxID=41844 RepID=A0ABD1YEN3_9MARC
MIFRGDSVCQARKVLLDSYKLVMKRSSLGLSLITESSKKLVVKKVLNELLPFVDLTSVHPELLFLIVKPLKVSDAEVLGTAIDRKTIQRCRKWRTYSQLRLDLGMPVLCHRLHGRKDNDDWLRTAHVTIDRLMHSGGRYRWSITPELTSYSKNTGVSVDLRGVQIRFFNLCNAEVRVRRMLIG